MFDRKVMQKALNKTWDPEGNPGYVHGKPADGKRIDRILNVDHHSFPQTAINYDE